MVAYHGGKQRVGKEFAEIVLFIVQEAEKQSKTIKGYCEPFCGACGVYRHIPQKFSERKKFTFLAGDNNESLILMWQSLQTGWKPPTNVNLQMYEKYKNDKKSSATKAFVAISRSFNGKWWNSYSERTSVEYCHNKLVKDSEILHKVKFSMDNYTQFSSLKNFIIYCDPPYMVSSRNTYYKQRNGTNVFDHEKFYSWCQKMSQHNLVLVSEYTNPSEIFQIKAKEIYVSDKNFKFAGHDIKNEKLFFII